MLLSRYNEYLDKIENENRPLCIKTHILRFSAVLEITEITETTQFTEKIAIFTSN